MEEVNIISQLTLDTIELNYYDSEYDIFLKNKIFKIISKKNKFTHDTSKVLTFAIFNKLKEGVQYDIEFENFLENLLLE